MRFLLGIRFCLTGGTQKNIGKSCPQHPRIPGGGISLPHHLNGLEYDGGDGETASGALWGGLFHPFEHILHPRYRVYCLVPEATPNLAIPHVSQVQFNSAMGESAPVEMGNKQEGVLLRRIGCGSGRVSESHVAIIAKLVDLACQGG